MKVVSRILIVLLALVLVVAGVFTGVYFTRIQTVSSIRKVTSYDDYNLYSMNVQYDYSLDDVINAGITDTQSLIDAIVGEALPLLPVKVRVPSFGCSAFTAQTADGKTLMGRNYDFKNDTSALLVYCTPKNGYKSVALAALDNISANDPLAGLKSKLPCLTAPFICLDGMNEKGVSIAVLTLDSEPTVQSTGKRAIGTSLAIRLVLDQAATTQEAVDLLRGYDMIASNGRDYHFYITDASGDGRIVEYDCLSETRELVDTPIRSITNFFALYADRVQPDQKNDIFGHGKERYEKIEAILTAAADSITEDDAWNALKAASQLPKEGDVTSNTQWSALYNDTDLTLDLVLRRDWDVVTSYSLTENAIR